MSKAKHTEKWRPVVGFEGWYSVSNRGRVRRERTSNRAIAGFVIKPHYQRGYVKVRLSRNGVRVSRNVHHLVMGAFCSPRRRGLQTNHKNGIKADNRPRNLKWVTPLQNTRHAISMGLSDVRGECNGQAKLTIAKVKAMRTRYAAGGISTIKLAREFGVSNATAHRVVSFGTWRHVV